MKQITLDIIEKGLEKLFKKDGYERQIIIPLCNRRFLEEFDNAVRREIIKCKPRQMGKAGNRAMGHGQRLT